MRYVSIDIETTGLKADKYQVVEFAAVIDELGANLGIGELPVFRALMVGDFLVDPYCAQLHHALWKEMLDRKHEMHTLLSLVNVVDFTKNLNIVLPGGIEGGGFLPIAFQQWLIKHGFEPDTKRNPLEQRPKITAAGKNFAMFDYQFLKNMAFDGQVDIRHRVIDVATHFYQPGDDCLPDTNTCLKRAGFEQTTDHTAVADARNVVLLVRKVMQEPFVMLTPAEQMKRDMDRDS